MFDYLWVGLDLWAEKNYFWWHFLGTLLKSPHSWFCFLLFFCLFFILVMKFSPKPLSPPVDKYLTRLSSFWYLFTYTWKWKECKKGVSSEQYPLQGIMRERIVVQVRKHGKSKWKNFHERKKRFKNHVLCGIMNQLIRMCQKFQFFTTSVHKT